MEFDDIIKELGEFGPYQVRMYLMVCLCAIPSGLQTLSSVFTLDIPAHRCALSHLQNDTYASQGPWHDEMVNMSIPWDAANGMFSDCRRYVHINGMISNRTQGCPHYVYSKDTYDRTVVSDLDLVCDDYDLGTYANMALMSGMLAGSVLFGPLSDLIGRKKVLVIGIAGDFITSFSVAFVNHYAAFIILRFLTMCFDTGMYMCAFVIGMELVGPSKRKYAGMVIAFFWCFGLFILNGVAYAVRDWRTMMIICACPTVLLLSYFWLMPESPRWLISKGRLDEARKILKKAAKVNKKTPSEKTLALTDVKEEPEGEKIWHMFTTPVLLIRCLIIFFNWNVCSMIYYGLSLNVSALSGDVYLNFFFSTLVELAAYVITLVFLDITGRKILFVATMLLGGISCILTMFPVIFEGPETITVVLSMIGKFGGSAAFAVLYIWSAELFPTVTRSSGIGVASFSARIAGVFAPYIADLGETVEGDLGIALPLIIFGGLCVAGGILGIWLPETLNQKLPDSIEDAKNFGRSSWRKKNQISVEIPEPADATNGDVQKATSNGNLQESNGNVNPSFEAEI